MTEPRRQPAGGCQTGGALDARNLTIRAGEILPTVYAGAREVGIAVSVALFCAVPVGIVVISRLWSLSEF